MHKVQNIICKIGDKFGIQNPNDKMGKHLNIREGVEMPTKINPEVGETLSVQVRIIIKVINPTFGKAIKTTLSFKNYTGIFLWLCIQIN